MSDLNLIPNPQTILIQSVIFLANMYVVNKLFVQPYLKLKSLRDSSTIGNQNLVKTLFQDVLRREEEITKKISKHRESVFQQREQIKKESRIQSEDILNQSRKVSKELLDKFKIDLEVKLSVERKKIPETIEKLTPKVLQVALH